MMMYCPMCGCPLRPNAQHCLECGESIEVLQAAVAPPPVAPVWPVSQPASIANPAALSAAGLAYPGYDPPLLQQWLDSLRSQHRQSRQQHPLRLSDILVRGLYFCVAGIWLSQLWLVLAWLLSLTVVGMPIAWSMIRVLPQVALMLPYRIPVGSLGSPQSSTASGVALPVRAVYFVLIGWWLSLIWIELAWALGLTIVGLPLTVLMLAAVPAIAAPGGR